MAAFATVGASTGRMARSWNLLGLAALLLAALEPTLLLEPPLILSLAAMCGVFLGSELWLVLAPAPAGGSGLWRRSLNALHAIGALFAVSCAAVLLTAPWSYYFFGSFYWGGVLANLIAVPAMGIAMPCLFVAALAVLAGAGAAHPWVLVGRHAGEGMLALIRALAGPSSGTLVAGSIGYLEAVAGSLIAALAMLALTRAIARRRLRLGLLWLALLLSPLPLPSLLRPEGPVARLLAGERALESAFTSPQLRVDVLPVGQGDAILIRLPGSNWLFDLGPGEPPDPLVSHLLARGVTHLDRVLLSHGHIDHWGGLGGLLGSAVRVDTLTLSDAGSYPDSIWRLLDQAKSRPVVERGAAGWSRRFSRGVEATLVHPLPGVAPLSENNASLGLLLQARSRDGSRLFRALFPGDLEREGEEELLAAGTPAPISLLHAGHHGSRTASSAGWIDALRPKLAYASLAEGNKFGFPHPEMLARYEEAGVRILLLDRTGALGFEVSGDHVRVTRECNRRALR